MRRLNSLLVFIAMLAALPASAQTIVTLVTGDDLATLGFTSEKTEFPAGTVIVENEAGSLSLAYDDMWGRISAYGKYRTVMVGDSGEIELGVGVAGNTNPTFVSYEQGAPTAGAVFEIKAKKDGWMTVFTKMNPNKGYLVFEGKTNAVAYTLGVAGADYKINYTLPYYKNGPDAGFIDLSDAETSKYFTVAQKQMTNEAGEPLWYDRDGNIVAGDRPTWTDVNGETVSGSQVMEDASGEYKPQFPWRVAGMDSTPGESTGFMTFRVKGGNTYYVSGIGTKMICQGFILTETSVAPTVTFCATEELPEVKFETGLMASALAEGEEFEYRGIQYTVVDADAKTVKTKEGTFSNGEILPGSNVTGDLTIPGVVSDGSNEYTVVGLGGYSFYGCSGLTSVSLPNTLTFIEDQAFYGCRSLTSIELPSSLEEIGNYFVASCSALTEITIPEKITKISWGSFDSCSSLAKVTLPDILREIETNAFIGCSGLVSVNMPDSLRRIDDSSFNDCGLTSIELPAKLEYIGEIAFKENPLVSVTLPASLIEVGETPFLYCEKIETVTYLAETPVSFTETFFEDSVYENASLSAPNAALDAVQSTAPWNRFLRITANDGSIEPEPEPGMELEVEGIVYTVIDEGAGLLQTKAGNHVEGDLVIPGTVTANDREYTVIEIGDHSFSGNADLRSVTLPATITGIGTGAFADCERLTSLVWQGHSVLPGRVVEEIGNPNLLLYVDSVRFASESRRCLVVADGVCESLELTPGYPFTPLRAFTANRSRMVKNFTQKTYIGVCAGWETIVLPFDVTEVYAQNLDAAVIPFALVGGDRSLRPFWLYEGDDAGMWKEASEIKAGVPYILSMPNNSAYPAGYNVNGPVVFSNDEPQVISLETTAPYAVTWSSGREFRSLWLPLSETEAATAMGLNSGISGMTDDDGELLAPGSAFHTGVVPRPLEAYVTRLGSERALIVMGDQSGVLPVIADGELEIRVENGTLIFRSATDRTVQVFTPEGVGVRVLRLKAGETQTINDLTPGIYIAAGRKVIVR